MGKRNKGAAQEEQKDTRTEAEKAADEEAEERISHLRFLAQDAGAEGGNAKLFRRDPMTKRDKFIESVATTTIWDEPHEYLQRHHGGGTFRITLLDDKGNFVKGASRLVFEVEGPPKVKAPETEETRKLDELEKRVEAALAKGADTSSADMMRLMFEITREQMREARNPPAAAMNANPMEMATNLVAALQAGQAPLLAALIERASQPAPDMIAQMQGLAEMMVTLRELSGGDRESRGWSRVVDRLADPLGNLLDQHVDNQKAGRAPPSTMGGAAVNAAPSGPPWFQMMQQYLPQLLRYAQLGRDPTVVADFVAEELPDQALGMIYATLTDPSFPDEFVRYVPDATPHREWFQAFFSRVLEWIDPPAPAGPSIEDGGGAEDAPSKPEVGTVARGQRPE